MYLHKLYVPENENGGSPPIAANSRNQFLVPLLINPPLHEQRLQIPVGLQIISE